MVIGLQSYYSDLIDGNYWAGSSLLARKMAAAERKTSKVPTGVRLLLISILWFDGMNVRARRVLRKVRRRNNKESMKYEGHIDKNNVLIKNEKINVNEIWQRKGWNGRNLEKKKQLPYNRHHQTSNIKQEILTATSFVFNLQWFLLQTRGSLKFTFVFISISITGTNCARFNIVWTFFRTLTYSLITPSYTFSMVSTLSFSTWN